MKRCVIVGASGFGREVAWVVGRLNRVAPQLELVGFCDDAEEKRSGTFCGVARLGTVEQAAGALPGCWFVCAIGNNRARQQVTRRAIDCGWAPATVVDPSAAVAPDAEVGAGCYIGIGSVVSCGSRLGAGVIVNHQACVGHDVTVGDFAQICPGVCVSGGCEIGAGALLGTLSGTIPQKRVGDWAVVGAGTVALKDVPEGTTLVRLGRG